jgi:outer membrane biosynthesis protein TonB
MAAIALRQEEGIGLAAAIIAHAALLAFLVLRPVGGDIVKPPERIAVTLSDEVGFVSTSPNPFSDAAPDVAPIYGEVPEPEPAEAMPTPPQEVPRSAPTPAPREVARPAPTPPTPRAQPKSTSRPAPDTRDRRRPDRTETPARRPDRPSGGSRLGSDFLEGVSGATGSRSSSDTPAQTIGPSERAALEGAISRQLKPHWSAPQGVDAELLVTVVSWNLNKDGSLSGAPRVVRQTGINDANRAQASRHAEQAIRAVQLAAPFNLPAEYYDGWKRIRFDFDKSLSR